MSRQCTNILLTAALSASCSLAMFAQTPSALTTYTAPDQSASAGVPAGWQVTSGAQTAIAMTGPQNVVVNLGATFIARNAAFQPGQKPGNGIDLTMPYTATLPQKLGMILEQGGALSGKPVSQFAVTSTTPLQLPATLGQCARIVAGFSGQQGAMKVMTVFCSLPLDSGGTYKNIMLEGQAPVAVAAQAAPTVQSIFTSYSIPTAWLQKKLAPFSAPAPKASAAAINKSTIVGAAGADNSANCFDLSVLRQTPQSQLPRSCGGTKPD